MNDCGEVTRLLRLHANGEREQEAKLFELVYQELRQNAHALLRGRPAGDRLESAELVNSTYLRLFKREQPSWQNRRHFYGYVKVVMLNHLGEKAREAGAAKRGGGLERCSLSNAHLATPELDVALIDLANALEQLSAQHPSAGECLWLCDSCGHSQAEVAEMMELSLSTIGRHLRHARAFVRRALSDDAP